MADTPAGETVTPESLSNEGTPVATPVVNAADPAEVEKARKEAEQARMYANQLENKLKAKEAEEAAAKAKQLEEKEEFKTLYEQTQSQLKEIQDAQAAAERRAELNKASDALLAEYPANVQTIAKTAGLTLSDDSDEAQKAFKEKLEALKNTVGSPAPSANNPRPPANNASKPELLQRMRGGDQKATLEYIRELPSIKRMKEIAQNGA